MDYLSWSRHYRYFPGQGDLAIQPFMEALQATGFDGLLSLEIFSDRFRAGSARRVAIDGQRSLLFLLDELRATAGVEVPGVPALPPRSRVEAIEFLEFAMDQPSAVAFENILARLGLRPRRRPPVEGGDALASRRHQHRRQPRDGGLRPFLQHHPRTVGLRDGAARRRRRGDARSRGAAARPAVSPGGRTGRTRNPGGAWAWRQPRLLR